ncbi:vinorine synthase [Ziziphus jujuba]|uniref:Vinorine synthase n=2 Tax=Ziziphus jujuba TaxID=326968 RepID=A0A6P3Z6X0_ZIZJJ|nr:vinorine synthase [Ziziphus jujuba]KAH7521762.1 hypothetical protein FEM48_Zijuj07G0066800 [Ziziphus jujuba var. spinosa]
MAAETLKVEIIHKETIKPSSSTPHQLRTHKLCLIDQFTPVMYVPLLLFYPNNDLGDNGVPDDHSEKTQKLKKTLSETLTHFYPLAGRIRNSDSIECNDNGVEFVEAKINFPLTKILEKPDAQFLRQFLAVVPESKEEASRGPLLVVQATFFQCGATAIGISFLHKVMDIASLTIFIRSWSAITLGLDQIVVPEFSAASLLPPADFSNCLEPPVVEMVQGKCRTRRLVFDASKISALQCKAASESVKNPTRVEAVSAFLWKSAMEASSSPSSSSKGNYPSRHSLFYQTVNIRPRTNPPLPENLVGNLLEIFPAKTDNRSGSDLKDLVAKLRKGMEEVKENYAKGIDVEEIKKALEGFGSQLVENNYETDEYSFSSWCRFPFYEIDFGWGKPIWVSSCSMGFKNFIVLMDSRDGDGIEAWLILEEKDMEFVERNQELLAFAALDPSVI